MLTLNTALLDLRVAGKPVLGVAHRELRLPALIDRLSEQPADIVCLQEVFAAADRARIVEQLAQVYPHVACHDDAAPAGLLSHGLMTLSRWPVRRTDVRVFDATRMSYRPVVRQAATLTVLDLFATSGSARSDDPHVLPLGVLNVHTTAGGLRGPMMRLTEKARDTQLAQTHELAERLRDTTPRLLCGDLNTGPRTSSSNYTRLLSAGYTDAVTAVEDPAAPLHSWDPNNPLNQFSHSQLCTATRLDHVLLGRHGGARITPTGADLLFTERAVLTDAGPVPVSDHYGVRVQFTVTP